MLADAPKARAWTLNVKESYESNNTRQWKLWYAAAHNNKSQISSAKLKFLDDQTFHHPKLSNMAAPADCAFPLHRPCRTIQRSNVTRCTPRPLQRHSGDFAGRKLWLARFERQSEVTAAMPHTDRAFLFAEAPSREQCDFSTGSVPLRGSNLIRSSTSPPGTSRRLRRGYIRFRFSHMKNAVSNSKMLNRGT